MTRVLHLLREFATENESAPRTGKLSFGLQPIANVSSPSPFMALLKNNVLYLCTAGALVSSGITTILNAEVPLIRSQPSNETFSECQIDPTASCNFSLALFRIWIPNSGIPVKGVLAILPGTDAEGTLLVRDRYWQAVAAKWNYGLLGVTFTTRANAAQYYRAEAGSGQALLSAIEQLAEQTGHLELKTVPIAILGHSQGGQFAFHFACWCPNRVAAFATIKGGYYDVKPTATARVVPGLLITANEDSELRRKNIRAVFDENSTPTARWAFASEPKAKHELGKTLQLIIPFFSAIINGDREPFSGDIFTLKIYPKNALDASGLAWFPNRQVADLWVRFMNNTLPDSNNELQISTSPVRRIVQISPSTYDFGNLEGLKEAPIASFRISRQQDGPQWDTLRAFSFQPWLDVRAHKAGFDWVVTVHPRSQQFVLGRVSEKVYIRFLNKGRSLLGGGELNVAVNFTSSSLKVSPTSLYLGTHSDECEQIITISAGDLNHLVIRSVELLTGTGAAVSIIKANDKSATIAARFFPLPETASHSGVIAINLDQPLTTRILIPFIGFYREHQQN